MADIHEFKPVLGWSDDGPTDVDAEMALLGALMVNNDRYADVQGLVRPEHFASGVHRDVYTAIGLLIDRGERASPVTLRNHLITDPGFDQKYLAEVADAVVFTANAGDLARVVHDCYVRRCLIDIGYAIVASARDGALDLPAAQIIEQAEAELIALDPDGDDGAFRSLEDVVRATTARTEQARIAGGHTGIATGIAALDDMTGGLHKGEPVWLGARPGMGKTGALISIALSAAGAGRKVAFFSLEEQEAMVANRVLSARTGINLHRLRLAKGLEEFDMATLSTTKDSFGGLSLHIDDTTGLTIPAMVARCKKLRHELGGLDLVVVDHLRLIQPMDHRASAYDRINEASEGLKMLAKSIQVAVLAAVQLNRNVEGRDDKRPTLSDLRQSGQLEEDARGIWFLFRQAYYEKFKEPKRDIGEHDDKFRARHAAWEADYRAIEGDGELIVAKQNNGPLGTIQVKFDPNSTAFSGG